MFIILRFGYAIGLGDLAGNLFGCLPVELFFSFVCLGDGLGGMDDVVAMMGRGVDGIELELLLG